MKKTILFIAFSLFMFATTHAQLGFKGGLQSTNLAFDVDGLSLSPSSVINFQLGVIYDIGIGDNLDFRTGLLYNGKGSNFDSQGFESDISLSYLNVPLNIVYSFGDETGKGFFINGGPDIGILMSASSEDEDVKEELSSIDLGFNLGAGYRLNSNLSLGVEFLSGLSNIDNTEDSDEITVRNRSVGLYVIYHL